METALNRMIRLIILSLTLVCIDISSPSITQQSPNLIDSSLIPYRKGERWGFSAAPVTVLFNSRIPCTLLLDGQLVGEVPKAVSFEEPGGVWSSRRGLSLSVNVQKGLHRFECRTGSPVSMAIVGTHTFKKMNEVCTFGMRVSEPTKQFPDTDLGEFAATDARELVKAAYEAKLHIYYRDDDHFILSRDDNCKPNADRSVSFGFDPMARGIQITSREHKLASGEIRLCNGQPYIHMKSPRFGDGTGWFPLTKFSFSTLDSVTIVIDAAAYARPAQPAELAVAQTRTGSADWRTSWSNFTEAVEAYQKLAYELPSSAKAFPEIRSMKAMATGERVPDTWEGMKRFGGEVTFEGRFKAVTTEDLMEGMTAKLEIEMPPSRFKGLNIYPKATKVASWKEIKPGTSVRFKAVVKGIGYISLFGVVKSYMLLLEEAEITTQQSVNLSGSGLIPYRRGEKWGFSDANKNLLIQAWYDDARPFSEGLAMVKLNGKYGYIDKSGKELIPFKYDLAHYLDLGHNFSEGLAAVILNGKYGYIDKSGKEVIPFKYDLGHDFSEGLAEVVLNDKCGYIDKSGKEVSPLKYYVVYNFSEGLAAVILNDKWGYINKSGKEVIPLMYDHGRDFSEGLAAVRLNGKYGYIDKSGKEVIPLKYDDAWSFSEGLAAVRLNGKYGYIDKSGKEVIPLKYDDVGLFSEGLAWVRLSDMHGYINKSGKISISIPVKYDAGYPFTEGLAAVRLNGKYGYIDKSGKEVIPLMYDYWYDFFEGLARVELNGKYGYIDKSGKKVIPLMYDHGYDFSKGLARVELNGKGGYIGRDGTEYFEP